MTIPAAARLTGLAALLLLALPHCKGHQHGHGDKHSRGHGDKHPHGHKQGHNQGNGHGHGHGDEHTHGKEKHTPNHEPEPIAVTRYTKKVELFMEYSPLMANQRGALLLHLTVLGKTFSPVRSGAVTARFEEDRKSVRTWRSGRPIRDGIFRLSGMAPVAARYRMIISVNSPQVKDRIVLPTVEVRSHAHEPARERPRKAGKKEAITFLKEQQWKIPFATTTVRKRELKKGIEVYGEFRALPDRHGHLAAPVDGWVSRIMAPLRPGFSVKREQTLIHIEPLTVAGADPTLLHSAVATAREALKLSRMKQARFETMARAKAVARFEADRARFEVAQKRIALKAARSRLWMWQRSRKQRRVRGQTVPIRAPLSGQVVRRLVSLGDVVSRGQLLAEVANIESLQLVAHLPEGELIWASRILSASCRLKSDEGLEAGRPDAVGAAIDRRSRTLPLYFTVKNGGGLRLGERVGVHLHTGSLTALTVPESALVDDDGMTILYVQTGGESFERRQVRPGIRHGGYVAIDADLRQGERVVSRGGYEILLSIKLKQTGAIGHGHAH